MTDPRVEHRSGAKRLEYAGSIGSVVLFLILFLSTSGHITPATSSMFSMIPALVIASCFGMWRGIVATLVISAVDVLLLSITVESYLAVMRLPGWLIGHGSLLLLAGILGRLRDISDRLRVEIEQRKATERALAQSEERAKAASRAKSRFLANMSHEIRTPMTGVVGMADLLLDTELDEEQRECAETICQSAEHMVSLINEILDLSKLEADRLELEHLDFGLEQVVAECADLLAVRAESRGVQLSWSIDPDLPTRLRGDPNRLRQVLTNLVSNSIKFTQEGEVKVSAQLARNSSTEVTVLFNVVDTGIGIPGSQVDTLFDMFTQADSSVSRKYGGTGLGLPIAKHLVERMGGRIGVRSEEGRGSTFWFEMPLEKQPEVESDAAASEDESERSPAVTSGARLLVAEDNEVVRKIVTRTLEKIGYRVDAVTNGQEAIDALKATTYDLVLMDVQMPGMDGLAATQAIRDPDSGARVPGVPIIALTAQAMKGDQERCLAAGMDDYVPKPIDNETLVGTIEKHLTRGGRQADEEVDSSSSSS